MLINDFFTIIEIDTSEENAPKVKVELNPHHAIFDGHFPGNPITPGVCLIQMIKEITEEIREVKLQLTSADNVKFMAIINPVENQQLLMELELKDIEDGIGATCNTSDHKGQTVFFKFKGAFKRI